MSLNFGTAKVLMDFKQIVAINPSKANKQSARAGGGGQIFVVNGVFIMLLTRGLKKGFTLRIVIIF
jgi:hypothetical protein